MKILYMPLNIASMPAITATVMNRIPGVSARGLFLSKGIYNSDRGFLSYEKESRKNPIRWAYSRVHKMSSFARLVAWSDIIHWTWDNPSKYELDLKYVRALNKPGVVEWVGSDIRVPEITSMESPWYQHAYDHGYEYRDIENKEKSYRIQEKFHKYSIEPILVPEMQLFLKPGLFSVVHNTQYRIITSEFMPQYPDVDNKVPVIVHAPSKMIAKGSNYIIEVIESIRKDIPLEFKLLTNVSHQEVLQTVRNADIFIDQVILGSYATAAIEAMCYGKPVLAYIMPRVFEKGLPIDCPIVNVTPVNIKEKLIPLILDAQLRNEIGQKSRQYVERVHDAVVIANELLEIYKDVISRHKMGMRKKWIFRRY